MAHITEGKVIRFLREGSPYFSEFEMTISTLMDSQKKNNPFVDSTLDMLKAVQAHLVECQDTLAKTETLVEEAREQAKSPEEIEKLVSLCRDLQALQTKLANDIIVLINDVVDKLFPR